MQDWEWLFLDAAGLKRFHVGEAIAAGQLVGYSVSGRPVHALTGGRVACIQYDIERDEIVLAVVPAQSDAKRAQRRRCCVDPRLRPDRGGRSQSRSATSTAVVC